VHPAHPATTVLTQTLSGRQTHSGKNAHTMGRTLNLDLI